MEEWQMNTKENLGGYKPTHQQGLLLRAALLQGEDALAAWEEWKAGVDIQRLDAGSYRLLPLLYRNLSLHEVNDPLMATFKGVYRNTWCKNQLLFNKVSDVLRAFHEAGIQTMLLKGAALTINYYRDYGLRPMSDFDILVPTADALAAMKLLRELGWEADAEPPERYIDILHAMPFKKDLSGGGIDLHWHVLHQCLQENADEDFWKGAISAKLDDLSAHVLNPTDQLFHVCVHGWLGDIFPTIRWVADAMTVINSSPDAIDWHRLVAQAEKRQLVLRLKDTLPILRDLLDAPVPLSIIQDIEKLPIAAIERLEYNSSPGRLMRGFGSLPMIYTSYLRRSMNDGRFNLLGLARYLQYYLGLEHLWQLPFDVIKRGIRRIWIDFFGGKLAPIPTKRTFRQEREASKTPV
ncbi:nucleotidyltransferase domain-containing protein [Kamptonema formosum]|uniref:nucleotidyltransferase domain-containing protein n=1 Tax=Kamptonema formosum TaxID=331992 RepID=UPI0003658B78|nr:nucleotidyltransferase family protein [Oscillatoria sp. PCC 10802]